MRKKHLLYLLFLPVAYYLTQGERTKPEAPLQTKGNTVVSDFKEAKKLAREIYRDMPQTFYCGCRFEGNTVDFKSCGFAPLDDLKRARRVEWEHIVPASDFGRSFPAWRDGDPQCVTRKGKSYRGRNCARRVSETFRHMEADLYNLVPAIGEINGKRGNARMGLLPKLAPMFGTCATKIADGVIEPREEVRGFIARTYKYMHASYPHHGIISRKNEKLFEAWDKMYPITEDESKRAERIAKIQGNRNRY
ncbi:MAG: endonuclease [Deltaproteobacteria bacterium]|nr:endonuclease [Deltaproteobacteria bacterium]